MKKITLGYIFNEPYLREDEKIFLDLSKKKNINLVMFNTARDFDDEELEKNIKQCDIFYNNSAELFSLEILKTAEEMGKRAVDSSRKTYYDEDKWMFFLKCKRHKIPTLNTILLSENVGIAKKELKEFNHWPVILKRVEGTMGEYVDKADNLSEAEKIMSRFWKKGSEKLPIIAQELVKSPSYRVTIIGDRIVQTAIKYSKGWKATGTHTSHFGKLKIDRELKGIIDRIIKVFGIKICGIDLFKKDGKWLVLEINSSPGFDFFEKDRKRLIGEVLDFLKKEVK